MSARDKAVTVDEGGLLLVSWTLLMSEGRRPCLQHAGCAAFYEDYQTLNTFGARSWTLHSDHRLSFY